MYEVVVDQLTNGTVQASDTKQISRAALGVVVESVGAERGGRTEHRRSGRRRCGKTDDDSRITHVGYGGEAGWLVCRGSV
jgi:hypothetical protein